jgi:hypothetical protein
MPKNCSEKSEGRDHLDGLGVDERFMLKWIVYKTQPETGSLRCFMGTGKNWILRKQLTGLDTSGSSRVFALYVPRNFQTYVLKRRKMSLSTSSSTHDST